jgi:hypothetical protein
MKLDPDKFLTELNRLFEANKQKGSVYVTMKRSACFEESFNLGTCRLFVLFAVAHAPIFTPLLHTI